MLVFKKILNIPSAFLILLIAVIVFSGCDQVDIIDPVKIYKENVVVRAELVANQVFEGVVFTKTLPLGATYSIDIAGLSDVEAYIKVNDTQVIPLHYAGNGLYKPYYDYTIIPGSYYELFADHLGDPIYSKTYVPEIPEINSVSFRSEAFFLQAEVKAKQNESYGSVWNYDNGTSGGISPDDFYSIEILPSDLSAGNLTVRTQTIPEQYRAGGNTSRLYIKVYAFDKAFKIYFKTKGNGKAIEDSFIHGGDNIGWNVTGMNAIGLFIGYSISNALPPK